MALKFTKKKQVFKHVKVMCHNTKPLFYILYSHMGGQKSKDFHSLAKKIWEWCIERNLWVSAGQIPGCNRCLFIGMEGDVLLQVSSF